MSAIARLEKHNSQHAEFARQYAQGPPGVKGNVAACYRKAFGKTNVTAYAYRLLKKEMVERAIAELSAKVDEAVERQYNTWLEILPYARKVFGETVTCTKEERSKRGIDGLRVEAAKYVVDRVEGKPRQEMHIRGEISATPIVLQLASEENVDEKE